MLGRVPRCAGRWRQPVRGTQSTRRGWQGLLGRGFPSPSRKRTERQRKVCSGLWPSSQTPPKTQAGSGVSAPEGKASANPKKKKEGKKKNKGAWGKERKCTIFWMRKHQSQAPPTFSKRPKGLTPVTQRKNNAPCLPSEEAGCDTQQRPLIPL